MVYQFHCLVNFTMLYFYSWRIFQPYAVKDADAYTFLMIPSALLVGRSVLGRQNGLWNGSHKVPLRLLRFHQGFTTVEPRPYQASPTALSGLHAYMTYLSFTILWNIWPYENLCRRSPQTQHKSLCLRELAGANRGCVRKGFRRVRACSLHRHLRSSEKDQSCSRCGVFFGLIVKLIENKGKWNLFSMISFSRLGKKLKLYAKWGLLNW